MTKNNPVSDKENNTTCPVAIVIHFSFSFVYLILHIREGRTLNMGGELERKRNTNKE